MKKTLPKLLLTLGIAGAVLLMAGCEQKQSSAQGLLSDTEGIDAGKPIRA